MRSKILAFLEKIQDQLTRNHEQVKRKGHAKLVLKKGQHPLQLSQIPRNVQKVVNALQKAGYEAYVVGGCIRDLLIGKQPKDFDVCTSATPEQVRRVFRNSRFIGRRFKIVHVVFDGEIIEVTTFRSSADADVRRRNSERVSSESGMLVRDNVYGRNLEEDAQRRDFTINALYYDLRSGELIDFHGGLHDLSLGIIDAIGDAEVRYHEDPVRMIRALRFCAKLGFKLAERTAEPIGRLAASLREVSNARMYDEINKMFLTGHGLQSYRILRRYHLLEILFPALREFLDNEVYHSFVEYALSSSDMRYTQNKRNMPHFLFAVMLWARFQKEFYALQRLNDSLTVSLSLRDLAARACTRIVREQNPVTAIPLGTVESIRSMWTLQLMLLEIDNEQLVRQIAEQHLFRGAFDIFRLRAQFEPYLKPYAQFWEPYYARSAESARRQQEMRNLREQTRDLPKRSRTELEGQFFSSESAAERQDRLEKARAWRAAMNLAP
ncbi:MAG: polynucleotide adenylyltransferase PcnB [Succinivibrio sp.]|nr:polynucleotide adenylyltransferase PcnB [Succinivibrio sp.]